MAPTQVSAKPSSTIAVLADLDFDHSDGISVRNLRELEALVEGEFDLTFLKFEIDWSKDNFNEQINAIYNNPRVDMLLVIGVAANQIVIRRKTFPKPTFLPFIVERDLVQAPFKEGVSGKHNLSYLSYSTQFLESIDALREVVSFSNVAVLADEVLLQALPNVVMESVATRENLTLQLVAHDGKDHNLIDLIPPSADAIMFSHLPRLPDHVLVGLIRELTDRKIPTFSYLEEGLVEKGLLATPINETLYQYAARRNALNMQAVMLGEPASQQPVVVETKSKLTINQATAEKIGVAIDFKVLVDADVLGFGEGVGVQKDQFNLLEITAMAVQDNLQLKDQQYNLDIQSVERTLARGRLLPQLSAGASFMQRNSGSDLVQSGFAVEQSTDAALNIRQTLFSDTQWTNYKIQSLLFDASSAQYWQIQLDVIREASLAVADVLQAQSEAAIQQENMSFSEKNLELAIDRVKVGASSLADQYRWETQVANAKSAIFAAFSRVLIKKQNLNRILNRSITAPIELVPLNMDELMVYSAEEVLVLMDNTATFEKAYSFALSKAFEYSPEIKRLQLAIAAKQRESKMLTRRHWMPEIDLTAQLSDNIDKRGLQSGNSGERDWQVMLSARIPFYQGGQIRSQRNKSQLERAQLENQLSSFKQQISQRLRASMNNLLTSLFTLDFTRSAAAAASRSLSLVTDVYSKGAIPVVDLLDAQNASISANLAEVQAFIGFFRSHIEMQRIIGSYEFLMSDQRKHDVRSQFEAVINSQ